MIYNTELWRQTKERHPGVFVFVRCPGDQWLITYGPDVQLLVEADKRGKLGLKPDVLAVSKLPYVTVRDYDYDLAYNILWQAGHPILVVWTQEP